MHPRAGTPALPEDLVDVDALTGAYYDRQPDLDDPAQRVVFGTSGHRGSALDTAFNEAHIVAITAAIVEYRRGQGTDGPLFIGRDTHALSLPAFHSALEVLAAAGVEVHVDARDSWTPTPAVSHAILRHNGAGSSEGVRTQGPGLADGIVVTPSHNPPRDGGFKYNPPHGGPAGSDATGWIADRANEILRQGWRNVPRVSVEQALAADTTLKHDYLTSYVDDLVNVVDVEAIRASGVRIGADPLGGASVEYWGAIGERYGLDLTVVNPTVDPRWAFMTLDWDGKIRMDCSSPYAMASLVARMTGGDGEAPFDIATGNDADSDRHGVVTPDGGLMNPNHYLAVMIRYLYSGARPGWPDSTAIGKTLVSSSLIDRVAADLGRRLIEVPVGFKWFVPGLVDGSVGRVVPAQGRHGLDDRQGRHPAGAARVRDPRDHRQVAVAAPRRARRQVRAVLVRARRRRGHARAEGDARRAVARPGHGDDARGRGDHGPARERTRERRAHRRPQGRDPERLVRRAAVGHGGRLQDLRRVVRLGGAPGPGPVRGQGRGLRGAHRVAAARRLRGGGGGPRSPGGGGSRP
jgi:phosphoglucomutase